MSEDEAEGPIPPESPEECVGEVEGADDVFSEEEWSLAQAKLEAMERESGLTFVQRARIRRVLESGGVLEPPVFFQRFGPEPAWVSGVDGSLSSAGSGAVDSQSRVSAHGSTVASGPSDSAGQIQGSTVASGPSDSAGQIQESTVASGPSDSTGQIRGSTVASGPSDSTGQIRGVQLLQVLQIPQV